MAHDHASTVMAEYARRFGEEALEPLADSYYALGHPFIDALTAALGRGMPLTMDAAKAQFGAPCYDTVG